MANNRLKVVIGYPQSGGGGAVDSVNGKTGAVVLDGTEIELINGGGVSITQAVVDLETDIDTKVQSVTAGSNVEVNNADPQNPIVSAFPTTTAGLLSRTYFTGDTETLAAGTFYKSNRDGKGTVATATQTITVNDNEKDYFAQDLIAEPYPIDTTIYKGSYSGILNGLVDSNGGEQKFYVEIYKTDLDGNPIASGITGAPVGDLGVTVVAIAESGLIDLRSGDETQFSITAELSENLSLLTTNRVRYHVAAEKVGTTGGDKDISISYGNAHVCHLDVPVQSLTSTTINDDPTEFPGLATQYDVNRWLKSNSSGGTIEEPFSQSVTFNGDRIQPQHSQTTDLSIDLAASGHSDGSSTLVQEVIGNGVNSLNLSPNLSTRLKGDNLNNTKKNRLYFLYDSRLSGDVYNRTIVTNYTDDLTNPLILSSIVTNTDTDALIVTFSTPVNVSGTTNTTLNFTSGTPKTITGVSGSGTNTITYDLSGDVEQVDVFTIDYASPSDVTSIDSGEGLFVPQSFSVDNQVVSDSFPNIASLQRRWDSYQGIKQDDSAGFVSGWTDSKNGVDISQTTLLNQPSFNATDTDFNGRPSIAFNGTSSYLIDSSLDLSNTNKATTVIVMKALDVNTPTTTWYAYLSYGSAFTSDTGSFMLNGNATRFSLWNNGDAGGNKFNAPLNLDGNNDKLAYFTLEVDYSATGNLDTVLLTNNVLEEDSRSGTFENTGNLVNHDLVIGAWDKSPIERFGQMNLAAIYVFDDILTTQEKTDLDTFINSTYGI
jgi:hypothetical protein